MRRTTWSTVRSAAGSVDTHWPSRMTVIRSQRSKTSSNRCEMNRTAAPLSRSERATVNSRSTSTPDRAAVGSSMTSTRASKDSALAISTICWSAMESPRAGRSGSSRTPSLSNSAAQRACISRRSIRRPALSGWRPMKMFSATERSGNSVGSW